MLLNTKHDTLPSAHLGSLYKIKHPAQHSNDIIDHKKSNKVMLSARRNITINSTPKVYRFATSNKLPFQVKIQSHHFNKQKLDSDEQIHVVYNYNLQIKVHVHIFGNFKMPTTLFRKRVQRRLYSHTFTSNRNTCSKRQQAIMLTATFPTR